MARIPFCCFKDWIRSAATIMVVVLIWNWLLLIPWRASATPEKETLVLSDSVRLRFTPAEAFFVLRCTDNRVYRLPASLSYTTPERDGLEKPEAIVALASTVPEGADECVPEWFTPVFILDHGSVEQSYVSSATRRWSQELEDFARLSPAELMQVVESQRELVERTKREVSAERLRLAGLNREVGDTTTQQASAQSSSSEDSVRWKTQVVQKHLELLRRRVNSGDLKSVSQQQKVELSNQLGKLASSAKRAEERVSSRRDSAGHAELVAKGRVVDLQALEAELAHLQSRKRALEQKTQSPGQGRSAVEQYLLR